MTIDIHILAAVMGITSLLQLIVLYTQFRVNRKHTGPGWWTLGSAALALGSFTILLRDIKSIELISIFTANALIFSGSAFLYTGVMRFLGLKENNTAINSVFAVFLLSVIYFIYFDNNITARIVILSLVMSAFSFLTAQRLLFQKDRYIVFSSIYTSVAFLVCGFFFLIRAVVVYQYSFYGSFFTPGFFQAFTFMFPFISSTMWTYGFIIMVNQRLNVENSEDREKLELIFNTSPDAVLISRMSDGLFTEINKAFTILTGFTRSEIIGKTSLEINIWKSPEDRVKFINTLNKNGTIHNMVMNMPGRKGGEVSVLISANIINLKDVPHIITVARDISELKRSEETLRESELKYRSLIENTSDVVFCVNEKGEYQFTNNVFASTFGKTPDYFIGKTFWDIYPKEHADYRQAASRKVFETGQSQSIEVTVPLPDRTMYFLAKANPIKDETGRVILNVTTATDITERKQIEEALRQKGEELERYFTSSLDLLCIADMGGHFLRLNPEWEKVLGYTISELEGRLFIDFVHPDDVESTLNAMSRLNAQEQVLSFENRYRSKDSSYRWIEWRSHPHGNLVYAAARDITERKLAEKELHESEEKYRIIFNNEIYANCIIDLDTLSFLDVNEAFTRIYGYSREELLSGITISDITAEHDSSGASLANTVQGGTTYVPLRYHRKKDGTVFPVEIVGGPYEWKGRKVMFALAHDITERKEAEKKIQSLLSEKELILREVHHRIKNNMNTIRGLLFLQADTINEPAAAAALHDAQSRVESMMILYDKLYSSSDFMEIPIKEYLPVLVDEIISIFPNKDIVKTEKFIDDFIVKTDTLLPLGIIINEILTNMMKYAFTGRDSGLITLSVTRKDNHVNIVIRDNGIGIPESISFEKSAGFGMELMKMLTEQIGGSIRIELDKGTKFILEFDL